MSTDAAVKRCREWADFYRKRGYQPLPSDPAPASEIILDKFSERLGKRFIYV